MTLLGVWRAGVLHCVCVCVFVCAVSNGIRFTVYAGHAPVSHAMRVYTPFRTITSSLISSAGRVPLTLPLHLKVNSFLYTAVILSNLFRLENQYCTTPVFA